MSERTRVDELAEDAVGTDGLHEDIVTLAEGYLRLRTELAKVTAERKADAEERERMGRVIVELRNRVKWTEATRAEARSERDAAMWAHVHEVLEFTPDYDDETMLRDRYPRHADRLIAERGRETDEA